MTTLANPTVRQSLNGMLFLFKITYFRLWDYYTWILCMLEAESRLYENDY